MDRASSLIFPGGRTLAGWWRQLSPLQPAGLWIGYGFVHRVEVAVHVRCEQPIDSFAHLVLQALHLEETVAPNHVPGVSLAVLEERLCLPGAVVLHVLAGMCADGLLTREAPERWQASELGRYALEKRALPVRLQKRRTFPFLERVDSSGERIGAPHFLPIAECAVASWSVGEPHRFDIACLRGSIEQSAAWKQAAAFPLEVEALADGVVDVWQQVVVDRPERVMLALVVVNAQGTRKVLGFAVKVDGWALQDRAPVLRVPAPADSLWPEIAQQPTMPVWQDVWRSWCKQRQLPTNEVELCALSYHAPRLEVQAPPRLVQRLHAAKSDLFKGEAWLLVGDGYCRTAVQLAIR
ncbi:MAG: hypothetical protein EXR98_01835 [Gemmataceae bacterium]|nr:hypothetical protein [Gemmataceae bacterium]